MTSERYGHGEQLTLILKTMEQENFTTKELVIAFVKLSTMVFLAIALTSIVEQL